MSDPRENLRKRALLNSNSKITDSELFDEDGNRPCPVCNKTMHLSAKKGVVVDVCDEHGIWLDNGELERIIMASRGRAHTSRIRALEKAERKLVQQHCFWGDLID